MKINFIFVLQPLPTRILMVAWLATVGQQSIAFTITTSQSQPTIYEHAIYPERLPRTSSVTWFKGVSQNMMWAFPVSVGCTDDPIPRCPGDKTDSMVQVDVHPMPRPFEKYFGILSDRPRTPIALPRTHKTRPRSDFIEDAVSPADPCRSLTIISRDQRSKGFTCPLTCPAAQQWSTRWTQNTRFCSHPMSPLHVIAVT